MLWKSWAPTLVLQIKRKDRAHALGFGRVDDQRGAARLHVVAQERHTAGPLPFAAGSGNFVPRALGNDFPFELSEGQ